MQCYLTEDAIIAIDNMAQMGIDKDFAIELLHVLWSEEEIYDLPEEN